MVRPLQHLRSQVDNAIYHDNLVIAQVDSSQRREPAGYRERLFSNATSGGSDRDNRTRTSTSCFRVWNFYFCRHFSHEKFPIVSAKPWLWISQDSLSMIPEPSKNFLPSHNFFIYEKLPVLIY